MVVRREELEAARDPRTPPATLARLAASPDDDVAAAVAANPSTPRAVVFRLAERAPAAVRSNPMLALYSSEELLIAMSGVTRPASDMPPSWLEAAAQLDASAHAFAQMRAAASASTEATELEELATSPSALVRAEVARHPSLPLDFVAWLATDPSHAVRAAVASAPATPRSLLEALAGDGHPAPRLLARSRLAFDPAIAPAAGGREARAERSYAAAARSSAGREKNGNEDAFAFGPVPGGFVAVVADGFGYDGDGGARAAVSAMEQALAAMLAVAGPEEREACILAALDEAHRAVFRCNVGEIAWNLATAGCVLLAGGRAHIGQAGDCDAYRLRRGRLERVTRDRALITCRLGETPHIDDGCTRDPSFHRLGGRVRPIIADSSTIEIGRGDVFLVCSDGIDQVISHDRIAELIAAAGDDLDAAAAALVAEAGVLGMPDDATAVLVAER